ncbi:MAG: hypothetical protein LH702_37255 [Phormidesmis sp. CAN_BIN44]|nr:hypothetical protein [Phormidesmis sp. CAN_BIN44]
MTIALPSLYQRSHNEISDHPIVLLKNDRPSHPNPRTALQIPQGSRNVCKAKSLSAASAINP